MKNLTKISLVVCAISLVVIARRAREADELLAENQRLLLATARLIGPFKPLPRDSASGSNDLRETPRENPVSAEDESMRKLFAMADQDLYEEHVNFWLIERGGKGLPAAAAKAVGLTEEQQVRVSDILTKVWSDATRDFASRAELIEEESDEKTGRVVYMIPARPDRGWEFKNVLLEDLADAVGKEKRGLLMKGYQSDFFFGGFGAQDIRLEFDADEGKFSYSYLNPLDGSSRGFGTARFEEFSDQFGDSFSIPATTAERP